MKRINIESNETHFIGCWNIEDNNLSKNMVKFFDENEKLQNQGLIGGGKDLSVKNSIDITIQPNDLKNSKFEIFNEYMKKLHECYQDYLIQYPLLKGMIKDIHIGKFNLQKYKKDGHFSGILFLVEPSNPTGSTHTNEALDKLAQFCRTNNILVYSDEIYSLINFDTKPGCLKPGMVDFYPEGTILANGFSKWASLAGWRVGYNIYPDNLVELFLRVKAAASYSYG